MHRKRYTGKGALQRITARRHLMLALLALLTPAVSTVTLAEAWAYTRDAGSARCAAMHDVSVPAGAPAHCAVRQDDTAVQQDGTAVRQSAGSEGPDPQGPSCPPMPAGPAASCMGAVALPGGAFEPPEPPSMENSSLFSSDAAVDFVLAAALFRPPRT